jgi:hypothetical protein
MSGLTWARNESDDRSVSLKGLYDTFLKAKCAHEARYNKPLKAVRLSRLTLLTIPLLLPTVETWQVTTFYGVPIEIDDSLGLYEFKEVHA